MVNNDDGLGDWFGKKERRVIIGQLQNNDFHTYRKNYELTLLCLIKVFLIIIINLCQIFLLRLLQKVFFIICVSLNKKYYICSTKDFILNHQGMLDGRSHCFKWL